jgi:hypothetical protein
LQQEYSDQQTAGVGYTFPLDAVRSLFKKEVLLREKVLCSYCGPAHYSRGCLCRVQEKTVCATALFTACHDTDARSGTDARAGTDA